MLNQIYRIDLFEKGILEFFVSSTNTVEETPLSVRELGVVLFVEGKQLDASLDIEEMDSLINYLEEVRRHCKSHNLEEIPLQ